MSAEPGAPAEEPQLSLLEKAEQCIKMSQELLYAGDNAGSIECALEAAKYLQLIGLLRRMESVPATGAPAERML